MSPQQSRWRPPKGTPFFLLYNCKRSSMRAAMVEDTIDISSMMSTRTGFQNEIKCSSIGPDGKGASLAQPYELFSTGRCKHEWSVQPLMRKAAQPVGAASATPCPSRRNIVANARMTTDLPQPPGPCSSTRAGSKSPARTFSQL